MHGGAHAPRPSNTEQMKGAWYFFTVPKRISAQIKKRYGGAAKGWGSLPVTVRMGQTQWETSIFPDTKLGAYVLPVKAAVRKREAVGDGDVVEVVLGVVG